MQNHLCKRIQGTWQAKKMEMKSLLGSVDKLIILQRKKLKPTLTLSIKKKKMQPKEREKEIKLETNHNHQNN